LLQCFREHSGHHIHIQHISLEPDASFFIKGDSGSDIHDSVAHFEGEPIVYKHEPNSFLNTNLLDLLKEWEIERIVVTGMMTHMCVDATARAAVDLGFQVIVAEDACASRDLKYDDTIIPAEQVHKAFLAALTWYGKVMKSDEIIALLASEMAKSKKRNVFSLACRARTGDTPRAPSCIWPVREPTVSEKNMRDDSTII